MSAVPKKQYSVEEYIELDKNSDERYEFFEGTVRGIGEIVAMSGGSINHGRISKNLTRHLENKLEGTTCEALPADVAVKVPAVRPYRYPDVKVACGTQVVEYLLGIELLVNPVLIIEVLSSTTAAYDLGDKFTEYQSIPSFREYLVISQTRPHVIQHVRQDSGKWLRSEHSGLETSLELETLNVAITLGEIYQRVIFA